MEHKKMISRTSIEVIEYKAMVEKAKRDAEVVTLREWYDTTENHSDEIKAYMDKYKQLGRLGKELHKRNVPRVTERYGDGIRTLVEATYIRDVLNFAAPICAALCTKNR
ncbi:hypothetical protein [Shewanella xiamenensis]|uniref:hypothetical protein n=1 Tax=Shewanella xiamenensis TaxID=332186 RepID=UPI00155A029C|nr:hypothetical protein [Shewanella xiamenensis]